MVHEDIYRDFVVRKAEIREGNNTVFSCDLEDSMGHKVVIALIIAGCCGEQKYRAQYDAIIPFCTVGALLHCSIVYRLRSSAFVMCINEIMLLKPIRINDSSEISVDTYFNPGRGFWVKTESLSNWIDIPGVIELGGESCIPLVEEGTLPLVKHGYEYDNGLRYGKRISVLQRIWRFAFNS